MGRELMPQTKRETIAKVRKWAEGTLPIEAGAELLIHAGLVGPSEPWVICSRWGTVSVDVSALIEHTAHRGGQVQRLVKIAASLLDPDVVVNLSEVLSPFERKTQLLILAALSHATGANATYLEADDSGAFVERRSEGVEWPLR